MADNKPHGLGVPPKLFAAFVIFGVIITLIPIFLMWLEESSGQPIGDMIFFGSVVFSVIAWTAICYIERKKRD